MPFWFVVLSGLVVSSAVAAAQDAPAEVGATPALRAIDYQREVRPILARHCFACHGADPESRQAGLRLDTREGAIAELEGGGRAVVAGDPDESELIFRVTIDDELARMPPAKNGPRLSEPEIATLTRWINEGAPYAEHWAFVRPERKVPPVVGDPRARSPIDLWIQEGLKQAGLAPASEAERAVLLRRLSLDLRGLPPTPEETAAFVADARVDAYERAVERYLADPAYGERWARVWLDLARYADSAGLGSDPLRPNMWRYRDWVIKALNQNMPYDQFAIEQLAGDLLPNATLEQRVATAFHRNTMTNTEGGTDDEEFRVAAVKDRVATTGQVFMGLTFGCAQCHTHKYDPISIKDYYSLYAFFNQSADNDQPDERPTLAAPTPEQALEIARIEGQIAGLKRVLNRSTPELEAAQARWEQELGATVEWKPLLVRSARGEEGTGYVVGGDGSLAAVGPHPERETITIVGSAGLPRISALRLETIPDKTLANGGAGRAADGNFVLSRVSLEAEPDTDAGSAPLARIVRVELPGANRLLSLAEVEVHSGGENVARRGEARQSSTAFGGAAERAIDGVTDGNYFQTNSTTHTGTESDPWWEVTLAEAVPVDRVVVWNRTDGALEGRLAGYRVVLLDDARNVVWQAAPAQPPRPNAELNTRAAMPVKLSQAVADFSQGGFAVEQAIAPSLNVNTGWAIAPRFGEPHWAVFALESPLDLSEPKRLTVRLEHQYREPRFTLGRFRLLVTADAHAARRAAIPADVLAALDTPVVERSEDQRRALARYYRSIAPELAGVRDEVARLEKSKPKPPPVPVMEDLASDKRRVTRILNKGNFLDPGDPVEAAVPAAFHSLPEDAPVNRLGLARWVVDERNPLTARVAVNRIWAQLFGVGLVETEEDFGTQGELPTHPELLDELATRFVDSGWDMKGLLRAIVTSATYRQSSRATPEQLQRDPRNRLLSRMPRVRLEAEQVRDQALALSGLLSRKIGGPSVYPPQPEGLWQAAFNGERNWATSTGPDRYRRGVYTFWRRTVPYPSMATFDAPSRETCAVKRVRTNTPLQAFVTLNDPAYVEAAQALARRIIFEGGETAEARARFAITVCQGRPADAAPVDVVVGLFDAERARLGVDQDAARALATDPLGPLPDGMDAVDAAAWTSVANTLLNLDAVLTKG